MKVAIIGNGWVGKAMSQLFPDALVYVRNVEKSLEASLKDNDGLYTTTFTDDKAIINSCDVAFICVPTPLLENGTLDTSIVEECIEWLETKIIVIRSTVNPGDCDRWEKKYNKVICMQPEYLGETPNHPLIDTINTPFLVIGGEMAVRRKVIHLYQEVYNANVKIRQVSNFEAEIIKLSENRAIAWKVAQCQELYDVCQKAEVDYYTIREAVYGDDPRFNLWWTFIYPDKRGFNSKCIPKDVYAWCAFAESLGYSPVITRQLLEKNQEWVGGEK